MVVLMLHGGVSVIRDSSVAVSSRASKLGVSVGILAILIANAVYGFYYFDTLLSDVNLNSFVEFLWRRVS